MEEENKTLNLKKVMHTWTLQMNYPLISATRDYMRSTARVTQTRFLLDTNGDTKEGEDSPTEFG